MRPGGASLTSIVPRLARSALGKNPRLNHLGSLYANIIRVLKEHIAFARTKREHLEPWIANSSDPNARRG